jgi:hypothetical protein
LRDGRLVLGLAIRSVRGHWVVQVPIAADPPGAVPAPAEAATEPPEPQPTPSPPKHGPMVYPVGRKRRRRRNKN